MSKVCILGLGYIGLPTAAVLISKGYKVLGVDTDEEVILKLKERQPHIEEPGIDKIVYEALDRGDLKVKSTPEESDVFIIAVPTPKVEDNRCELRYVLDAASSILPFVKANNHIIIESTIPPGTTENIIKPIFESKGFKVGKDLFLAHCPERVLPGKILEEIINNNRIVGGCTELCSKKISKLYNSFVLGEIILTDSKTAELTKLMENTYRDVNIALANELVKICDGLKINALDTIKFANMHPRVNILNPGPGVGGHCLAIDPYFIIEKAPEVCKLITTAREINSSMPEYIVEKVKELTKGIIDPKIAVFGLTYKENINDLRESPAIKIFELLKSQGYLVTAYDPHIKTQETCCNEYEAVKEADMILILTGHDEFKTINYNELVNTMKRPIIFDTKNIIKNVIDEIKVINLGNINSKSI